MGNILGSDPVCGRFGLIPGFWFWQALTTGTAWAGLCLIQHHPSLFFFFNSSLGLTRELPPLLAWPRETSEMIL